MSPALRWTEQAVEQLGAIASYISLSSPVYAEGIVDRIVARLETVRTHPHLGRAVPEFVSPDTSGDRAPMYRSVDFRSALSR